jgi:hypothetical protein
MADLKKIKEHIRELAHRKKNVRLSEIEWVVNNLALNGFESRTAGNEHQKIFTINKTKFGVCTHHTGSSQLKPEYVKQFVVAMIELGLYDDEN